MNAVSISPREKEVLTLVADGKTSAEIAAVLGISYHTASGIKERLKVKFEVYKETALIAAAFRRGVLS